MPTGSHHSCACSQRGPDVCIHPTQGYRLLPKDMHTNMDATGSTSLTCNHSWCAVLHMCSCWPKPWVPQDPQQSSQSTLEPAGHVFTAGAGEPCKGNAQCGSGMKPISGSLAQAVRSAGRPRPSRPASSVPCLRVDFPASGIFPQVGHADRNGYVDGSHDEVCSFCAPHEAPLAHCPGPGRSLA